LCQTAPTVPPFVNTLTNRRLRFHGNSGKAFCFFQVLTKRSGGYEGAIRVGKTPDVGTNGEIIRFPLGTAEEAERFVTQMKLQYEKEGFGVLVYDSLVHVVGSSPTSLPDGQVSGSMPNMQVQLPTQTPVPVPIDATNSGFNVNGQGSKGKKNTQRGCAAYCRFHDPAKEPIC
jgi:hypothetical protein